MVARCAGRFLVTVRANVTVFGACHASLISLVQGLVLITFALSFLLYTISVKAEDKSIFINQVTSFANIDFAGDTMTAKHCLFRILTLHSNQLHVPLSQRKFLSSQVNICYLPVAASVGPHHFLDGRTVVGFAVSGVVEASTANNFEPIDIF